MNILVGCKVIWYVLICVYIWWGISLVKELWLFVIVSVVFWLQNVDVNLTNFVVVRGG